MSKKKHNIPENGRQITDPYNFTFCPFCGEKLRKGSYPISEYKSNTYVVCDNCDIQLLRKF